MTKQYISKFWQSHEPVLSKIEFVNKQADIGNQPLFVLDDDPKLCASYLTTYHIMQYIEYIVYSIIVFRCNKTTIEKADALNKPRVDYMFYNQRTAYWFYVLYTEMQEIYKKRFGKYYKVTEYFKDSWIYDMTKITGPMNVKHKAHKSARLIDFPSIQEKYTDMMSPYAHTFKSIKNRIGKFRIAYMIMGYLISEFPFGAPAWYNNMRATIWKSFNKMTRLYYRIDTSVDGVYSYYYSVDDKNWIEIKNIPVEFRSLIDGIIFAREV